MPGSPSPDDDRADVVDETNDLPDDWGERPKDADGGPDGLDRRTLIRVLVALALGIPILVELRTVISLVGSWIAGEDETPTATPPEDAVGIGDELLPETTAVERLQRAEVVATDEDTWPFTVVVDVENTAERPYRLELGAVTTRDSTVVEGGASTDRIPAGESATLANSWPLPEGETPEKLAVRAELGDGTPEVIDREVVLRGVAFEG